jgi:2-oxo-4-hydroxy-4-carboxy-5-ureidoimidazoline decarboxylase
MTIEEVNRLAREEFVREFGWVYEGSAWVAERAHASRPFVDAGALHASLAAQVDQASRGEQLALLRAHPDLGARAKMSDVSVSEQAGAGLDRLSGDEFELLHRLNSAYKEKFGFPFILAVKGSTKHDILKALESRLRAAPEQEFRDALAQVKRISFFRIEEMLGGTVR